MQVCNADGASFHVNAVLVVGKTGAVPLDTKLQVWGLRMGAKAPKSVPLPQVLAGNSIALGGQTLEIRGLDDALPHRSYVWIPSIKTIAGSRPGRSFDAWQRLGATQIPSRRPLGHPRDGPP